MYPTFTFASLLQRHFHYVEAGSGMEVFRCAGTPRVLPAARGAYFVFGFDATLGFPGVGPGRRQKLLLAQRPDVQLAVARVDVPEQTKREAALALPEPY